MPSTVALIGPTASGKTTVCTRLAGIAAVTIIACDDYYKPRHLCPTFELESLPWARGAVPPAFAERGNADFNVPEAVDWERLCGAVHERQQAAAQLGGDAPTLLLEGHLLLGAHPGAAVARAMCSHIALLDVDGADREAMRTLWQRKWARAHWGKRSYRERGVTEEEYAVYWNHFVWPAWQAHGGARRAPPGCLRLDATQPAERIVETLYGTGWFPPVTGHSTAASLEGTDDG
jgi:energy-coupling factor transporter ATP-binding protein EcfA2